MKNIDLNNIKVVVFDFDDTLAIHKDKDYVKHRNENEEKRLGYYLNAYENPETFYEEIEPCDKSETLCSFINELRNKNIKMCCLSGMNFSFHFKAKQNFINKNYGNDIELFSAGSQQLKLDGIRIIQQICNCSLDEILFIDDRKDVVELMNSNSINAILITDLTNKEDEY